MTKRSQTGRECAVQAFQGQAEQSVAAVYAAAQRSKTMDEKPPTRRAFYQRMIFGLMSLMVAALAGPALAYLFVPSRRHKESGWVDAGDVTTLESNQPKEVVFQRRRVDGWKTISERATAWVVKTNGRVTAFAPQCTHLACGYHWDEHNNQFICPCHASMFSIDGRVLGGPAPRPLDRFKTRVEGTRLWLGQIERSPETTSV